MKPMRLLAQPFAVSGPSQRHLHAGDMMNIGDDGAAYCHMSVTFAASVARAARICSGDFAQMFSVWRGSGRADSTPAFPPCESVSGAMVWAMALATRATTSNKTA